MSPHPLAPTRAELLEIFRMRHGDLESTGWQPRMRQRFGHFTPDEHYEALVAKLVTDGCRWLDVGCGRKLFPSNVELAETLSKRAGHLTGVDPDETLDENPFVHEKVRGLIDDFEPRREYDVVTLRMVAEHIADPARAVATIRRCLAPGGRAVIYTVNRWSPVPLVTGLVPFRLRHPIKKALWRTESVDTFPTCFRMNTRATLRRQFAAEGVEEEFFTKLDDCRSFARFRVTSWLELAAWRALRAVGLHYPENCLLGVYRRP
ncbi:MAG: class I SAM-dependent methyltransferase [Planctomycetes bacterium]|nr:class I SAM-dependent methyltransferase [Planctomycetota bacterium]